MFSQLFSNSFWKELFKHPFKHPATHSSTVHVTHASMHLICPFQVTAAVASVARRTTTCLTLTRSTSTSSSVSCRPGRRGRRPRSIPSSSTRTRDLRRNRSTRSPFSSPSLNLSTYPIPSVRSWIIHSIISLQSCQLEVFSSLLLSDISKLTWVKAATDWPIFIYLFKSWQLDHNNAVNGLKKSRCVRNF